ncbi:M48 family metallopeptidase [Enterococcus faecalis]
MCKFCKKNERKEVSKFRYKFELPIIIIGIIMIIMLSIVTIGIIYYTEDIPEWMLPVLFIFVTPLVAFFSIRYLYIDSASDGVEITKNQLPEIYSMYIELAKEMGFGNRNLRIPRLYLVNGSGVLNAFAAKCTLRNRYIVVHSDILDIYYKTGDISLVRFIMAHELGHHKCGHTNIRRVILSMTLKLVGLEKSLTRAQEYTADRVALFYAREGAMSMIYLFSGKYMGDKVDLEEYFESIDLHDDSIWLKLNNFLSSHPVGFRRMKTLKKATENGTWDVHGKFF